MMNGREGGHVGSGLQAVVEADDRYVLGHAQPCFAQRFYGTFRHGIVAAEQSREGYRPIKDFRRGLPSALHGVRTHRDEPGVSLHPKQR